jgi:hypothetical protein
MSVLHPGVEPGIISDGPVIPREVFEMVRMKFWSILVGVLATWVRRPRKRASLDTERLCDVGCDAVAAARFYDRRAF